MIDSRPDSEVEEIRRLLRALGIPAEPSEKPVTAADERILAAVLAGDAPARPVRLVDPRPWRRPRAHLAVAAAAAVALVIGSVVWQGSRAPVSADTVPLFQFTDVSVQAVLSGTAPPAGDVLRRLADVAAAQPVTFGEGDQEVSSYSWLLASSGYGVGRRTNVLAPTYRSTLLRPDGSVTAHETRAPALDLEGRVVDGTYPPGGAESTDELPAGTLDPQRALSLPREPAALRDALLEPFRAGQCQGEQARAMCLTSGVTSLYGAGVVPSDLAAAMWAMFADEPAMASLGDTTDRLGRPGVAVAFDAGGDLSRAVKVLIISSEDGRLLQWEEVVADFPDLGIDSPTVTAFQAYLSSRWVERP